MGESVLLNKQDLHAAEKRCISEDITNILQRIEYYFQEIRVCYLRWVTHEEFRPPTSEVARLCANDDYLVIASPYGRAFTLSPCGLGSCYVGGGQGCVKITNGCYPNDAELKERTDNAKSILSISIKDLKKHLLKLINNEEFEEAWTILQDYYWIKLGVHEFVFDLTFCDLLPNNSVRNILINSLKQGEDIKDTWQGKGVVKEDLVHFIKYGLSWNRYACCAFDCGPIALSKKDFVHFSVIARLRSQEKTPCEEKENIIKREWAKKILRQNYDLLLCYDEAPLMNNQSYRYQDWVKARPEIIARLNEVDGKLMTRII